MSDSGSDLVAGTGAAGRGVNAVLRVAGGRSVMLRMPAAAVPGDATEQLGLATPQFQDVVLAPVVFRKARAVATPGKAARWELLVSAAVVTQITGSLAYSSASVLFAVAFGISCDDALLEIVSATAEQVFGEPYLYRLVLQGPQAQIT